MNVMSLEVVDAAPKAPNRQSRFTNHEPEKASFVPSRARRASGRVEHIRGEIVRNNPQWWAMFPDPPRADDAEGNRR
jgi:hypothetical protein